MAQSNERIVQRQPSVGDIGGATVLNGGEPPFLIDNFKHSPTSGFHSVSPGCAIHLWIMADPIIKDCWIARLTQIIPGEFVRFRGKDNSTAWLREECNFDDLRYYLRITMKPIRIYPSLKELIGVFKDILNKLCQKHYILHRDISFANLMMTASETPEVPG